MSADRSSDDWSKMAALVLGELKRHDRHIEELIKECAAVDKKVEINATKIMFGAAFISMVGGLLAGWVFKLLVG